MQPSLDFFPANVNADGIVFHRVRVIVADDRAYVFGLTHGQPALMATTETERFELRSDPPYLLAGGTWTVARSHSCACGPLATSSVSAQRLLSLVGVP